MHASHQLSVSTVGDREIVMTRQFDAPRALVWEAWTRPELLLRWFHGPEGWTLVRCLIDLIVGGSYRYEWLGPGGETMGVGGVYEDIAAPERLVFTESFDDTWYPGQAIVTIELADDDGRTALTNTIQYESAEAREIALQSDMETGVAATYAALDLFLPALIAAEAAGLAAEADGAAAVPAMVVEPERQPHG